MADKDFCAEALDEVVPKSKRHKRKRERNSDPRAGIPGSADEFGVAPDRADEQISGTLPSTDKPGVADRLRLAPIAWSKLSSLPKRASLISDLLDAGAISVAYGPSGCGKTFL